MLKRMVMTMASIILLGSSSIFSSANVANAKEQGVKIDKTNFPGLYQALKDSDFDRDNDGYLTEKECNKVKNIISKREVSTLEGIVYFPNLTLLKLDNYTGTDITITKENEKLETLCVNPQKSELVINAPDLKGLYVGAIWIHDGYGIEILQSDSKLKALDIASCTNVKALKIFHKNISSLKMPKKNSNLESIEFGGLKIKKINFKNYKNLSYIILLDSQIKNITLGKENKSESLTIYSDNTSSIDLSKYTKLKSLTIEGDKLTDIKWPEKGNLQWLEFSGSPKIKSLNLKSCTKLVYMNLTDSYVESLDLSQCANLKGLHLRFNSKLTRVDASGAAKMSLVRLYGNRTDSKSIVKLAKGNKVQYPATLAPMDKLSEKYMIPTLERYFK